MQEANTHADHVATPNSARRIALTVLLGWLAMVGLDFFLHGGLLAGFYVQPDPFLLPPAQAAALIPVGYLSFLLLSGALVWLVVRLGIVGWREGALFGLKLGALVWGALVLGLATITTAPPGLLVGWFIGEAADLALAGYFVGAAMAGASLKRLFRNVLVLVLVLAIATIALQSLGIAPAVRAL